MTQNCTGTVVHLNESGIQGLFLWCRCFLKYILDYFGFTWKWATKLFMVLRKVQRIVRIIEAQADLIVDQTVDVCSLLFTPCEWNTFSIWIYYFGPISIIQKLNTKARLLIWVRWIIYSVILPPLRCLWMRRARSRWTKHSLSNQCANYTRRDNLTLG